MPRGAGDRLAADHLVGEAVLQRPRQLRTVVRIPAQKPDPPQNASSHRQRKDLLQDQESLMSGRTQVLRGEVLLIAHPAIMTVIAENSGQARAHP